MICKGCGEDYPDNEIQRRKLNTMYRDEESNWLVSCEDCYQDALKYYQQLWSDYYNGRL